MENNMMNRPVTARDVANRLNLSTGTVYMALSSKKSTLSHETIAAVREMAKEMGYDPKAASLPKGSIANAPDSINGKVTMQKIASIAGVSLVTGYHQYRTKSGPCYELALKYGYVCNTDEQHREKKAEEKRRKWYRGGNFHSKTEEKSRMMELRAEGYSNEEIAKKVGRAPKTVRRTIGSQSADMTLLNRQMGQKIRAQKNEARRLYVRNHEIAQYNTKVKRHNQLKAELEQVHAEIGAIKPRVDMVAAQQIVMPQINLALVQPTALQ